MRPIAMPATGRFRGTPACMRERVPPQTEAMDDEPFDSRISETTRDRVGEFLLGRKDLEDGPSSEVTMADLAAARTEAANLADREGGEVIVEHKMLAAIALDVVENLLIEKPCRGSSPRETESSPRVKRAEPWVRGRMPDLAGDGPDVLETATIDAQTLI